jgi:hypothetical protein
MSVSQPAKVSKMKSRSGSRQDSSMEITEEESPAPPFVAEMLESGGG